MDSAKTCSRCGRTLPRSDFYGHKAHGDGFRSDCKDCAKRRNREHYHEVVKHRKDLMDKKREFGRKWYQENVERSAKRIAMTHRTQREVCLKEYGGECECCGEDRFEFLSLHHRNGGGYKQRQAIGGKMARWLVQNGFPKDQNIGILCHNCNSALGYYGYCPHQREAKEEAELEREHPSFERAVPLSRQIHEAIDELTSDWPVTDVVVKTTGMVFANSLEFRRWLESSQAEQPDRRPLTIKDLLGGKTHTTSDDVSIGPA